MIALRKLTARTQAPVARTHLTFHHDMKAETLQASVLAVVPFPSLDEANQQLFKAGSAADHVVITDRTIFHPQGGGQPSDVGTMQSQEPAGGSHVFDVAAVRMDAVNDGQVLHFGRFAPDATAAAAEAFAAGSAVTQRIDADKRRLYSRLHTAGHVLGAAVRHLLAGEVAGFDELKASHAPGAAACEFAGLIDGARRPAIQARVDAYVARAMPVEIGWWDAADFRANGLERLIPAADSPPPDGGRWRVVKIVGAEVYPCGGTHVERTDLCGETTVRKITRSKGTSRVSYTVAE